MKKIIYYVLLIFIVSSCTSGIPLNKINYVNKIIICDSKAKDFKILNQEELSEFFNENKAGVIVIKYEYWKAKKVKLNRKFGLFRSIVGGKMIYRTHFDRLTFPLSECRRLKAEKKVFK